MNGVIKAQGYAIDLEHTMREVFGYDEMVTEGLAAIVTSDFIRSNPLAAVLTTCGYIYGKVDEISKQKIDDFINETRFYWEMKMDDLLSFETSSRTIGLKRVELEHESGEKALNDIKNKFEKICKLIKK